MSTATLTPAPAATTRTVALSGGQGRSFTHLALTTTPHEHVDGALVESDGHLYIELDGKILGSLRFAERNGKMSVSLYGYIHDPFERDGRSYVRTEALHEPDAHGVTAYPLDVAE